MGRGRKRELRTSAEGTAGPRSPLPGRAHLRSGVGRAPGRVLGEPCALGRNLAGRQRSQGHAPGFRIGGRRPPGPEAGGPVVTLSWGRPVWEWQRPSTAIHGILWTWKGERLSQ
jgi:hypothetical protein